MKGRHSIHQKVRFACEGFLHSMRGPCEPDQKPSKGNVAVVSGVGVSPIRLNSVCYQLQRATIKSVLV